jgi:DNA-binding transcriptional MerR regulator
VTLKQRIHALREQGKSYKEIERILKCARSSVAYHLNSTTKAKVTKLRKEIRRYNSATLKEERGNKCESCGYDRHPDALHFHHRDPKTKEFNISSTRGSGYARLKKEADKCALLCGNCHVEVHKNIRPCPPICENSMRSDAQKAPKKRTSGIA